MSESASDHIETEEVLIPPRKRLMRTIGLAGYSIPEAINELVDNSIDAAIEGQPLLVQVLIGKAEIAVKDNGTGMNADALQKAFILAETTKRDKLGRYGIGLKSASTFLGKWFRVETSPQGDARKYSITWDEDEWLKGRQDEWKLTLHKLPKENPQDHGTNVTIRRLKHPMRGLVTRLRKQLAQSHSPRIKSKEVEIWVNRKRLSVPRYKLIEGSHKNFDLEVRGDRIYGWHGLLERGSQKGLYGFTTYNRNRTITTYDKIGIRTHPTLSRIVGEVHMDHVPVSYTKREFLRDSIEYREAEEALKIEFRQLVRDAQKAAATSRLTPKVKKRLEAYKAYLQQALKAPELRGYRLPVGVDFEDVEAWEILDSTPRDVEIESRSPPSQEAPQTPGQKGDHERKPREKHDETRNTIRIKGRRFDYEHRLESLGLDGPWKDVQVDERRRLIEIMTNTDFPLFSLTKDLVLYSLIHIAESVAEIMVRESGEPPERVNEVREIILREVSKIASQVEEDLPA
ncbi:MAG: ATP-binding protein [Thermoplasmata archaeon]